MVFKKELEEVVDKIYKRYTTEQVIKVGKNIFDLDLKGKKKDMIRKLVEIEGSGNYGQFTSLFRQGLKQVPIKTKTIKISPKIKQKQTLIKVSSPAITWTRKENDIDRISFPRDRHIGGDIAIKDLNLSNIPEYNWNDVFKRGTASNDFLSDFKRSMPQYFIIKEKVPGKRKFLVDTRGYNYARYAVRIDKGGKVTGKTIKPVKTKPIVVSGSKSIKGKNIYVTGKVRGYTKPQIKAMVIKAGGNYASGVTKSLDLLVIANNPGQNRLMAAARYNISTMNIDEFRKIAGF